jgi:hypothetical protein
MPPTVRVRTGTGTLYTDNSIRDRAGQFPRTARRGRFSRLPNHDRLWVQGDEGPIQLDWKGLVTQMLREVGDLLDLMRDVGAEFQFCLRRRHHLDPEFLADYAEVIDWFVVFYTVGLVDRRGAWLGDTP